jgi:hypothetical protein
MYTYTNGNYIEATISSKEQLSFLELTDSVKTISLQLKNAAGTDLTDPVNNIVYKVSKNYGLIQMTRFLNFPTATAAGNLIGLTVPKKGLQLITSRKIFNFDIGDEFHYDSLYQSDYNHLIRHIKMINTVSGIYRSVNTDTVIYTIEQQKETQSINTQTWEETYDYTNETIKEKHTLSKTLLYPGQANLGVERFIYNAPYHLTLFPDDETRSVWNTNGEWYEHGADPNCWGEGFFDPTHDYSYLEGCGLLSDYKYAWGGIQSGYKHLVYFQKGSQRWGDALIITSNSKRENIPLALYPNPLKQGEVLHFNTANFEATKIIVYSSSGNQVLESDTSYYNADLSKLQPGLYLVKLLNDKNEFLSGKLIIK